MNIRYLGERGSDVVYYCSEPEKAVILAMSYDSYTLIMEPGELADFARGHKLLTNSNTEIVILNEQESYFAPEGDCFHIFLPVTVRTTRIIEDGFLKTIRIITKTPSYREDSSSYLTAYK